MMMVMVIHRGPETVMVQLEARTDRDTAEVCGGDDDDDDDDNDNECAGAQAC